MRTANAKETAMKTTKTSRTNATMTAKYLTTKNRAGRRPIEAMGWKRLAAIYAATTDPSVCRAIAREARRCGYNLRTILALNTSDNALTDDSDSSPAGPM
jgi:siroheme synthase (precorrin-2 oxidase/ferrochelatase)